MVRVVEFEQLIDILKFGAFVGLKNLSSRQAQGSAPPSQPMSTKSPANAIQSRVMTANDPGENRGTRLAVGSGPDKYRSFAQ